ncbi:hypothetical protein NDU88_006106 [Pleurodeles waltl]|uniref:Uncharacterized protein n=1 Tax=Pleurodeles waltl TaxID=8319 RepID=A0AAV7X1K7_PLEWA|nr:hypothetical protein NDU88_006106 [Pleurodeles waltl]
MPSYCCCNLLKLVYEYALYCSRELDSPTTSNIESGAERRSADSCGQEIKDIGNPDGRIPEHIPARSREEEAVAEAGNPDIRVPNSLKREDGLCVRRALNTRDAEKGGEQGGERREVVHGQTPAEEQTSTGQDDTATGQDSPKELERHHVPGGTWLSQPDLRSAQEPGAAALLQPASADQRRRPRGIQRELCGASCFKDRTGATDLHSCRPSRHTLRCSTYT